jgi:hypothetical protein
MRAAGVDFTSHDLRHRWGIAAYRSSNDLLAVAEMMGHSAASTRPRSTRSADSEVQAPYRVGRDAVGRTRLRSFAENSDILDDVWITRHAEPRNLLTTRIAYV